MTREEEEAEEWQKHNFLLFARGNMVFFTLCVTKCACRTFLYEMSPLFFQAHTVNLWMTLPKRCAESLFACHPGQCQNIPFTESKMFIQHRRIVGPTVTASDWISYRSCWGRHKRFFVLFVKPTCCVLSFKLIFKDDSRMCQGFQKTFLVFDYQDFCFDEMFYHIILKQNHLSALLWMLLMVWFTVWKSYA